MTDLLKLKADNQARWAAMRVSGAVTSIDATARRLVAEPAKTRYRSVSATTGVPWFVIAVIHEREASQDWTRNLAQGDPWDRVSIHDPKGRGPFSSWAAAALDALQKCPPYAAQNTDWSAGGTLTLLERYNGLGYAGMGKPSPYIWASTDQYVSGKYVADHDYRADVVDHQIGCAALIKRMMTLDSSISFGGGAVSPKPTPIPPHAGKAVTAAVTVSVGAIGAHQAGVPPTPVIIGAAIIAVVLIAYFILRRK